MSSIREFQEVARLVKKSPRSPQQLNGLFEADCEIIKTNNIYFCSSTDSIGEEISIGLYQDPYLWGWMTVMSSVSDLTVTGSKPLGLLLSTQWKFQTPDRVKDRFYLGANAALKATKVALLGGDSGYSGDHVMTSTILGTSKQKPLTRMGIKPGDLIALVDKQKTGIGPCIAYRYLFQQPEKAFPESLYRPRPSPKILMSLRPFLHATIDTSDGLATCLYLIARLNKVGLSLTWNAHSVSKKALSFCQINSLHPLMLWMGDHGDFQSLVFFPKKNLNKIKSLCPNLTVIGHCTEPEKGYQIHYGVRSHEAPFAQITDCARDVKAIYDLVKNLNQSLWKHFGPIPRQQ